MMTRSLSYQAMCHLRSDSRCSPDSRMISRCCAILFFAVAAPVVANADDARLTKDQQQLFEQAAEILTESCLKCHTGDSAKSELDLTTHEGILAGGKHGGPAFDADSPAESSLVQAIEYDGFEMPPTGQMSSNKISILKKWVLQGMPWPADHKPLEAEPGPPEVNDEKQTVLVVPACSGTRCSTY